MKAILPYMGNRRSLKIKECISIFENKTRRNYTERKSYSRGATIVWARDGA